VSTHSTRAQDKLLNVSSVKSDNSALLTVAHGSTVNPDSSAPTLAALLSEYISTAS
jgi:hypothetical protein